jgi:hypothetical protein
MEPSAGLVRRVVQAAEARQAAGVTVRMPAWVRFRPVLARLAAALVLVAGLGLGAAMGGSLPRDGRYTAEGIQSAMLDFPVDALSAVPPGSVAEAYLDLMEQNEGEGS